MPNGLKGKVYTLLRWSERYIKVDMVYLASGGFWLTLGQAVSAASVFVLALVFAYILPKETYGTYKYLLSIMGLLSIFTLPGMVTALTRSAAKGLGPILPAMRERMRFGIIGLVAGLGVSAYYFYMGNHLLGMGVGLIAVFLPIFDPLGTFSGYILGKREFARSTRYMAATQIIMLVVLAATAYFFGHYNHPLALLVAYLVGYTLVRLYFLRRTLDRIIEHKPDPALIPYGRHLSFMGAINQVAMQLDNIILFHYAGAAAVAVYAIAIAPAEQVKGLLSNLGELLFPRLAARSEASVRSALVYKTVVLLIAIVCLIALYIFIVPYFFALFFPKYLDSVFYSQLFALSMLNTAAAPASIFLQAHAKIKDQYAISVSTSIFQIVSMGVGAAFWGILGLVIARIATRLFGGVVILFLAWRPLSDSTAVNKAVQ